MDWLFLIWLFGVPLLMMLWALVHKKLTEAYKDATKDGSYKQGHNP